MFTFLLIIHLLVCVLLILAVLLQQPQKGGMSVIFGGGESIFGGAGVSPFMSRVTSALAALLLITSISLVLLSAQRVPPRAVRPPATQEQPIPER